MANREEMIDALNRISTALDRDLDVYACNTRSSEPFFEDIDCVKDYIKGLENENYTLKEAYELACGQLNDYQTKLFDLEKKITHIVRVYGCRDGVYPISGEKWQKTLLDAVKKRDAYYDK